MPDVDEDMVNEETPINDHKNVTSKIRNFETSQKKEQIEEEKTEWNCSFTQNQSFDLSTPHRIQNHIQDHNTSLIGSTPLEFQ